MCAGAQSAQVCKAAALVFHEGGGIAGVGAKRGGFLEKAGGRQPIGREALAEEGGAKGATAGGILLHQRFQGGGEPGHPEAKLTREVAV